MMYHKYPLPTSTDDLNDDWIKNVPGRVGPDPSLKHQPGQHAQSTHTPEAYRGGGAQLTYYDPDEMYDKADPWAIADQAGIYISSDKEVAQVALVDDEIVGAVFEAVDYPNMAYSADIAVLPEFQGRGIGSQLADATVENFKDYQAEFPDLTMEIDAVNPIAAEMLERRGAVEVGRTENHILMRMKHQAGRHDQSTHTPKKYGGGDLPVVELSDGEFMALHRYGLDDYEEINPVLRKGMGGYNPSVEVIDGVMERSQTERPLELYRVGSYKLFGDVELQAGVEFTDLAYMSTSASRNYLEKSTHYGGKMRAIINVPAGVGAIDMSAISGRPYEQEILLERGLKYRVTDVDEYIHISVEKESTDDV
jgi:ribosomal protein S18 acetylase RimI-like enzyme